MKRLLFLLLLIPSVAFGWGTGNDVYKSAVESGSTFTSGDTVIGYESSDAAGTEAAGGSIMCWQDTVSGSGDIDTIGVFIGGLVATEDITLGIYTNKTSGCSDNSPCPDSKLGDTGVVVGSSTNPETIEAALDSPITLSDGGVYWVCIGDAGSHGSYLRVETTGGTGCLGITTSFTEGTMPTTLDSCATESSTLGAIWGIAE